VGIEDVLAGRLRDILRTVHAAATSRSPRAPVAVQDGVTGCLQDSVCSIATDATPR
jgi:hypothetical protein